MSYVNLTTETMVTLSERWLDPKRQRKLLTSLPLLVPLIPILQAAHRGLIGKQRVTSTIEKEIAAIQAKQLKADTRHDRKIRGSHGFLSDLAELADDPEMATSLLDLRDRLLPTGVQAVTRSYVDEAGDAKRLPARLDDASNKLLSELQTPDGPLRVHVDAWLDEAHKLGELQERREHLEQQLTAGAGGPTAADALKARTTWIRAVRALESNLALEPKADAETVEKILGPLQRAEAKADRRRVAASKGKAEGGGSADGTGLDEPVSPAVPGAEETPVPGDGGEDALEVALAEGPQAEGLPREIRPKKRSPRLAKRRLGSPNLRSRFFFRPVHA